MQRAVTSIRLSHDERNIARELAKEHNMRSVSKLIRQLLADAAKNRMQKESRQ